jgi:hypothetical protein
MAEKEAQVEEEDLDNVSGRVPSHYCCIMFQEDR